MHEQKIDDIVERTIRLQIKVLSTFTPVDHRSIFKIILHAALEEAYLLDRHDGGVQVSDTRDDAKSSKVCYIDKTIAAAKYP